MAGMNPPGFGWEEHAPGLKRFIHSRVRDEDQAEDILQDVAVKVLSRLGGLREPDKIEPWIYRICRNTIIDHYRRKKIATEPPDRLFVEADMEEERFRAELGSFLRGLIRDLPPKYRRALVLTAYEGLTQRELGRRLGLSLSGAKSRVRRARERLKAGLSARCNLEFDCYGRIILYSPKKKRPPEREARAAVSGPTRPA